VKESELLTHATATIERRNEDFVPRIARAGVRVVHEMVLF
jgi:hypothetical protein